LTHCELCPRRCGVNRLAGALGFCQAGAQPEVFRYGAHPGEEPPLSGDRGSGAVFFSRCTLHCLYCQNFPWSQEGQGTHTDSAALAEIFRSLARRRCHNWNLVSPTPWWPLVMPVLDQLAGEGVHLPVALNTSGFERVEILQELEGRIQVYLTDLRYASPASAGEGSGRPDYVAQARSAFREMWRQVGALKTDPDGVAVSGVICRLLILPGLAQEAVENLRWLADTVGVSVPVSVMAQYTPTHQALDTTPWNRPITREEYDLVVAAVESLGFTEGWIQEFGESTPHSLVGFQMTPGEF